MKFITFEKEKYEAPIKSNFKKAYMHLTNYSINKMSEEYVKVQPENILTDSTGTKRTLSALYKTLREKGIDVELVQHNIAETCGTVM